MELDRIILMRQRHLLERLKHHHGRLEEHHGRITTLESAPSKSSLLNRTTKLAEVGGQIYSLLRTLYQAWPLLVALAMGAWKLLWPAVLWLWQELLHGVRLLVALGMQH